MFPSSALQITLQLEMHTALILVLITMLVGLSLEPFYMLISINMYKQCRVIVCTAFTVDVI